MIVTSNRLHSVDMISKSLAETFRRTMRHPGRQFHTVGLRCGSLSFHSLPNAQPRQPVKTPLVEILHQFRPTFASSTNSPLLMMIPGLRRFLDTDAMPETFADPPLQEVPSLDPPICAPVLQPQLQEPPHQVTPFFDFWLNNIYFN